MCVPVRISHRSCLRQTSQQIRITYVVNVYYVALPSIILYFMTNAVIHTLLFTLNNYYRSDDSVSRCRRTTMKEWQDIAHKSHKTTILSICINRFFWETTIHDNCTTPIIKSDDNIIIIVARTLSVDRFLNKSWRSNI